ncbi:MAG: polysaccharide pyruvyl transferase family protein [Planctomycetota bacterium]|jgi:colanic acid/amylovoran biosynthesis protein
MRILVTNIYSWNNKGDAAIVLAMLDHVKRSFPGARITLSSHDTDDAGRYGDHDLLPSIISLVGERYPWPGEDLGRRLETALGKLGLRLRLGLFCLLRRMGVSAYTLFDRAFAERLKAFGEHDLVIACGGGYLITKGRARLLERAFGVNDLDFLCDDFALAAHFDKPYILFNQSIGPFYDAADARRVRRRLEGAAAVFCREGLTYQRVRDMGLTNARLTADVAFGLKPWPSRVLEEHGFSPARHNIGLTVRRCLTGAAQDRYEEAVAEWIGGRLAADPDTRCYFVPQVIHEGAGDNDLHTAYRVRRRLDGTLRSRAVVIDRDLHPGQLMHAIGRMDLFVGTRMHSNIFSLATGVKTLAISYEPKTDGIMRSLGLEEDVVHASEITARRLDAMADRLMRDDLYSARLRETIHGLDGDGGVIAEGRVDLIGASGLLNPPDHEPENSDHYRRSA